MDAIANSLNKKNPLSVLFWRSFSLLYLINCIRLSFQVNHNLHDIFRPRYLRLGTNPIHLFPIILILCQYFLVFWLLLISLPCNHNYITIWSISPCLLNVTLSSVFGTFIYHLNCTERDLYEANPKFVRLIPGAIIPTIQNAETYTTQK